MKTFLVKKLVNRQPVEQVVSAATKDDARVQAGLGGAQVISVKLLRSGSRFDKMRVADRLIFFQRLASMIGSRVGTTDALDVIHQSFTGVVRDAARILRDQLMSGATLHEAMQVAGPRYFPDTVVAIVKTGARGGDLAFAILEAARFEKELDSVKRTSSKGLYGAVASFAIGLGTILVSTIYVAPMIMESSLVKGTAGVDIGWVMTMANWTTGIALFIAACIASIFIFGVVLRPLSPAMVDRGILRIPFYRDMALAKNNYMVFFGLAVLLKAGLRVEEALELTVDSAPKGELRNDLERALVSIVKGSSKPWPYQMRLLHPTDRAALATAQDRKQTAATIENLSQQYQTIYRQRIETFVPAMQTLSVILLSIAGFVLFAVSTIPLLQSMTSIMKMV
ncbi:type II secretion system F family protein [Comamonas thiooxydans]|uniref:type II secretion system F family protein n=1 Tax=Comamonas thiooxydans TaxID=363952 RepID=UPI000B420F4F|nr:type II secretion system F family protein [Comamonas thiooxydans]